MSTKRRKISHDSGATGGDSPEARTTQSKTKPAPKPKDPSPPSTSDADSATLDNGPKQETGDAAPKSFADLVWDLYMASEASNTDMEGRGSSTHFATPATSSDTRGQPRFKNRQSPLPCRTEISLVLLRLEAAKRLRLRSRFSKLSSTNLSPSSPWFSRPQESLPPRLRRRSKRLDP
jgi:hypothetical protein